MKILITTPIYPPEIGGPATYVKEIAIRLKNDCQLTILAFADNAESIEGVKLISVSKKMPLLARQFIFFFKLLKWGKKTDIIYVQNAMAAGLPSVIAAKILGKPSVLKFVGDNAWESAFRKGQTSKLLEDFLRKPNAGFKNKLRMYIQKLVLQNSDEIIVPSNYLGKILNEYYGISKNKIVTIYNAAEADSGNDSIGLKTELHPYQIITVARLVPWKGIDGIIKAVKILINDLPDIKLIIAGDGPDKKHLRDLTGTLGLNDHVKFVGNVPKKETARLRRESVIFVLNSVYEGLPHTVLSSFAAGIPVIATDIPGTNEAVYDGKTGLLIPPQNPERLAQAIKQLLADTESQQKFIANGRQLLKDKFSWESHIAALTELLHSVLFVPLD